MSEINLTDPIDIKHAIERKGGGYGALGRLARQLGVHRVTLSKNISNSPSARRQPEILKKLATYLGQPVHGVRPNSTGTSVTPVAE